MMSLARQPPGHQSKQQVNGNPGSDPPPIAPPKQHPPMGGCQIRSRGPLHHAIGLLDPTGGYLLVEVNLAPGRFFRDKRPLQGQRVTLPHYQG